MPAVDSCRHAINLQERQTTCSSKHSQTSTTTVLDEVMNKHWRNQRSISFSFHLAYGTVQMRVGIFILLRAICKDEDADNEEMVSMVQAGT